MKTIAKRLAASLLVAGAAPIALAQAQPATFSSGAAPTRGLEIPAGPIVGEADATAIELNPGQLGLVEHTTFSALINDWADDASRTGRGTGLYLALPFGPATLGGSMQWLNPTGDRPNDLKTQIAFALRSSTRFGIGVTWNHFFSRRGPDLDGLDSFDVGASYRPIRHLGIGLAVRDANRPGIGGPLTLQRVYASELTLRPFGDSRLELAGGAAVGEQRATPSPQVRLWARLARGFNLFAQLARVPLDLAGGSLPDLRATLGVALDFERTGVALAALANHRRSDGGVAGPGDPRRNSGGGSVMLRFSGDARIALHDSRRIERVDMAAIETDRDFVRLTLRLRRLAHDPFAAGILLDLGHLEIGLGRIDELRDLIEDLRKNGKKSYAFFTDTDTRGYFLASACDRIFMQHAGTLTLNGLAATTSFYKSALDKLGVQVDLVRIAEYKGAMEPFVRPDFSEAVRANLDEIVDVSFNRIVAAIARGRGKIGADGVQKLIDQGLFSARDAQRATLIDDLKNRNEIDEIDGVTVTAPDTGPLARESWATPHVAVVLIDGPIVDGKSEGLPLGAGETSGARTIAENLEQAAADGLTRAVVLRVNSPGGSVTASEDIARAIRKLRKAGKPVIVSMGDVAASGGYYVSAPADMIFAEPLTTTGSIGIYTYHLDGAALADTLGVSFETIKRGERSDRESIHRAWDDGDREQVLSHLRQLYDLFLDTIVEGRKAQGLDKDKVDAVGRGLVMKGERALKEKLIDRTGGFTAAVDEAVKRAGIPVNRRGVPDVIVYENVAAPLFKVSVSPAQLTGDGDGNVLARWLTRAAGPSGRALVRLLACVLANGDGALALPPFDVTSL